MREFFFVQPLLPKILSTPTQVPLWMCFAFFPLCQFHQQDPVANNDTLAKKLDAEYLILCQTALS
jgi:hypothetical protein